MEINLATTFGELKFDVTMIINPEGKPPSDIQTEATIMILRKAVMRCDLLKLKDDAIYQKLKKLSGGKYLIGESGNPFNEKEVNDISDLIWAELTKPVSTRMKFKSIWKNIPVYDPKSDAPVPWLQRFFSALGDWISSIYQEEKKYVDQLESIKDCLTLCHNNVGEDEKIRELDAKDKEKLAELQDKLSSSKDSKYGDSDHQAYLLEQIIMLLVKTDPKNPFAKYKKETREAYDEKVRKIKLVDQVRADYSRQCFIGVIGPQNAGKSTLLNTVFNQNAETGKRKHTLEPTLYPLLNRTYVIDFPGSNALDIPGSVFQTLGEMNNLFIYVMEENGTPNKDIVNYVKTAYAMQLKSGKASKTLFCINQAAVNNEAGEDSFHNNYRALYVDKIRAAIEKNPYDELAEEHEKGLQSAKESHREDFKKVLDAKEKAKMDILNAINEEHFMFTDLKDPDPKRGIRGPKDIRQRILEFLVQSGIRDEVDKEKGDYDDAEELTSPKTGAQGPVIIRIK